MTKVQTCADVKVDETCTSRLQLEFKNLSLGYNHIHMNQTAEKPKFPPFRTYLTASMLLLLFGWGGLAVLVATTLPTLGPRWLFFFLLMTAITGTTLPVTYFINRRFMSKPPADGSVILREAMLVGVYGCLLAWLQQGRVLTAALCLVLALGFILVEVLIRVRELSLWKPNGEQNE